MGFQADEDSSHCWILGVELLRGCADRGLMIMTGTSCSARLRMAYAASELPGKRASVASLYPHQPLPVAPDETT